jgi:hypothetical protein
MRIFAASLLLILLAHPVPAGGTSTEIKFRSLETEHLRVVYYDEEQYYIIPHLARSYENSMGFYRGFFGYTPSEQVTVFFQDFDDYGYAGTSTIPNNYITLGIEPFEYVYETCPTNERINWVMMHELMHVVASENATGADEFFRAVMFGKVNAQPENPESILYTYLTNPRRYAPRWYHEGIAVFMETWLAGGIGRALGGYDEMVFRSMVRDGAYFYDVVGLESEGTAADFQVGQNSYLYGTRFMSYLAVHHGPERVIEWVNRAPGSKGYYASQFKKVFGASLDDEWSRWIEFEHAWQEANLDSIRQYPLTPERTVCDRALGSASRSFYDEKTGKLYAAVNYPGELAHIAAIDFATGSMEKICHVQTPALYYVTSLAFDPDAGTLFFTTNNGKHWRDLNCVDVHTGRQRRLLDNNRTGDLVLNPADKSLWGVQHHNGFSTLVRIEPPYDDWGLVREVLPLPYGKDIFDLDISPDGRTLTCSMIDVTGRVYLVQMEVASVLGGDGAYEVLWEFANTAPANFVFSRDGRYLYGTSYVTGVSNVFRYNFDTLEVECLTNCETGYFRPVSVPGDSLCVLSFTGGGFRPVVIPVEVLEDVAAVRYLGNEVVARHPVVKDWKLGSPRAVELDERTTYKGDYGRLRNIELMSLYPVVQAYKDNASIGFRANFMDPVGLNGGDFTATFTPTGDVPGDEIPHLAFRYRLYPWSVGATLNRADFYDFFGPTKTSRKGYSVSLARNDFLIADSPRFLDYTLSVAHYGDLERLPDYQNVAASFDRYTVASVELNFDETRRTIGAVEPEQGLVAGAGVYGNYVNEELYSSFRSHVDIGGPTGWDHSSVWLRNAAGYSFGDPSDSFAYFYFGGFGNNWVDHGEVKRYRDYESFPGVELNEISGTNFARSMVEWTLPPVRFRRLGFPSLYCTWARPALFTTGIVADATNHVSQRELVGVGAQVDFRMVIFSGLESMFSMGFAGAFEEGRKPETEFMISLKLL